MVLSHTRCSKGSGMKHKPWHKKETQNHQLFQVQLSAYAKKTGNKVFHERIRPRRHLFHLSDPIQANLTEWRSVLCHILAPWFSFFRYTTCNVPCFSGHLPSLTVGWVFSYACPNDDKLCSLFFCLKRWDDQKAHSFITFFHCLNLTKASFLRFFLNTFLFFPGSFLIQ